MKAIAAFPGSREIRLISRPEPAITRARQVKLRMLEVGVCGTDREIARFEYGTPPADSDHLVVGHESLGEVVEVGAEVQTLRPGDLAVAMVRRPCDHPECFACRAGRQDFCFTGDFKERGIKGLHGFLSEYVVDEERYLLPVRADLREVAVLTEPLTIAEKALTELSHLQKRLPWGDVRNTGDGYVHKAVVLGAGAVGLLGAMTLRSAGFSVYIYSRSPAPNAGSEFAGQIGATYLCSSDLPVAEMAEELGNIDVVYEATGAADFSFQVLEHLGTNGIFVFTGVPGRKAVAELDLGRLMRRLVLGNQVVLGSVNASAHAYRAAIEDLGRFQQRWPGAVRSLITGRYPMEAFTELVTGRSPGGIKNVIRVSS